MADLTSFTLDTGAVRNSLGEFAYQELLRADLLPIATKLLGAASSQPEMTSLPEKLLTPAEMYYLESEISLALLGTLVRLRRKKFKHARAAIVPIYYLPLGAYLTTHGRKHAIDAARVDIMSYDQEVVSSAPIYIVVDSWKGRYSFLETLHSLQTMLSTTELQNQFFVYGPSTAEVHWLKSHDLTSSLAVNPLETLLQTFHAHAIQHIEGGWDLEVHKAAARLGFTLTIAQKLQTSAFSPKSSLSNMFLADLSVLMASIEPLSQLTVWHPLPIEVEQKRLEESKAGMAVHLLRAVALGRLFLPDSVSVRAPLSLLGPVYAKLIQEFGADDLGCVALDKRTARLLNVSTLSSISDARYRSVSWNRHSASVTLPRPESTKRLNAYG